MKILLFTYCLMREVIKSKLMQCGKLKLPLNKVKTLKRIITFIDIFRCEYEEYKGRKNN